jgi:beta-galactosidase
METTAGPRGGGNASVILDKGAMRAAMWHDIGHGADLISYWQWRDALNGGEQNHGGIVDVDGEPDPIYTEVAQVGSEFEKAGPALKGTSVDAHVAILHSYPSRWTINWQRMVPAYDPIDELMSYYKPLHELGYTIDIVPPDRDLSKYKLVVAPGLNVLTQAEADNLSRYVKQGGHLVLGQRSAMKDEYEARWPQRQPGPLAALLGARVEQYTALDSPIGVDGVWGNADSQLFAEQLTAQANDVKVLMRYKAPRSWLDGQPAAVARKVGDGSISYIGAWLDDPAAKRAAHWMLAESGVQPDLIAVPNGVEVYRRAAKDRDVFIIENDSLQEQTVDLPATMKDLLNGGDIRSVTLPVYGVAVLEKSRPAQ